MKKLLKGFLALGAFLISTLPMLASEANLVVPAIKEDNFNYNLLIVGIVIAAGAAVGGFFLYRKYKLQILQMLKKLRKPQE